MDLHKILKMLVGVLGLAGIIFLIRIISKGDEAIKAAALDGDTAIVEPMAIVAYIILGMILLFVVFFVLKNLVTNTGSLKSTLIGLGAFVGVLVIAYVLSGGDTNVYKYNGIEATSGQSQMVGAGLIAFYILICASAVTMLFSGIKKMIK
ncbi:hypothetical protein A9Q87_03485 [Flavobacteriales bacterium 34_180_T64]|nr:hypothetical protein A9Q87_03485 [Flavobacteriales bacterium 34_180_T64]